jgi:hypothetical protein
VVIRNTTKPGRSVSCSSVNISSCQERQSATLTTTAIKIDWSMQRLQCASSGACPSRWKWLTAAVAADKTQSTTRTLRSARAHPHSSVFGCIDLNYFPYSFDGALMGVVQPYVKGRPLHTLLRDQNGQSLRPEL